MSGQLRRLGFQAGRGRVRGREKRGLRGGVDHRLGIIKAVLRYLLLDEDVRYTPPRGPPKASISTPQLSNGINIGDPLFFVTLQTNPNVTSTSRSRHCTSSLSAGRMSLCAAKGKARR